MNPPALCEHGRVTAWQDFERAEPEFAQRVRALFDAHRHKTIATLRADGSPRISGIEAAFEDGELVFGSMPGARKGADLRRDPRFALHSATVDPVEGSEAQWPGEAKISGRAIAAEPVAGTASGDRFRADIADVVHTHLGEAATMLVVDWWTPTHGLRTIERG
jgi:Pyridoxamine 5'-phosphate oxidase